MSVYSRNVSLYLNDNDERYSIDDRNNNVKNSNKSIENSVELTAVQTNNDHVELQLTNRNDAESKLKCNNSGENVKMENNSNDKRSSDSIETTKNSVTINFSVDSILNSPNASQTCNKDTLKLTDASAAIPKSTTLADDFSRIHRPMPMRYVSNSNIFQGNPHESITIFINKKRMKRHNSREKPYLMRCCRLININRNAKCLH